MNARNHAFDAMSWFRDLDSHRITQLHVVGYSKRNQIYEDFHAEPIQSDLWALIEAVLEYAGVEAIVLERDTNFPRPAVLAAELRALRGIGAGSRYRRGACPIAQ